jgi:predicted dienelactone hydrolase
MRLCLIATFVLLTVAPVLAAPASSTTFRPILTTGNGLTYSAWLPRDFSRHHHDVPLILFSHGFGGCAQQSRTLTQALADAGYAVLAPNHKDKGCERYTTGLAAGLWKMMTGRGPDKSFGDDARWDASTEVSRRDDVENLLDFALSHAPYKNAIDASHIGLMGHSLGGYTVLGLAGGWPSWRDRRFKAVLALAPFSSPFIDKGTLAKITIPVMYMGGTRDRLIAAATVRQSFALTRAPKYLVMLADAGHFAFTELSQRYQATIAAYAVAVFDKTLRARPAPLLDQPASGQVARFEHRP